MAARVPANDRELQYLLAASLVANRAKRLRPEDRVVCPCPCCGAHREFVRDLVAPYGRKPCAACQQRADEHPGAPLPIVPRLPRRLIARPA